MGGPLPSFPRKRESGGRMATGWSFQYRSGFPLMREGRFYMRLTALPSFPRKRESRTVLRKTGTLPLRHFWIPAYAGMTVGGRPSVHPELVEGWQSSKGKGNYCRPTPPAAPGAGRQCPGKHRRPYSGHTGSAVPSGVPVPGWPEQNGVAGPGG